jgi:hypothetical protein
VRFTSEEEVYVTMIVVKRPSQLGQSLDPARWTDAVLRDLQADAPDTFGFDPRSTHQRALPRYRGTPRPVRAHPWVYLALSMACFVTAGSLVYWFFIRS